MRRAIFDQATGKILSITDSPEVELEDIVTIEGEPLNQKHVVIHGHDGRPISELVEKMRVKHDNGDGTVELEEDGRA